MDAAIRAAARTAAARGIAVHGMYYGFAGLVEGQFEALDDRAACGILQRGGAMLGSWCFPAFRDEETQQRALRQLREANIGGLVVIGGGEDRAPRAGTTGRPRSGWEPRAGAA